MDHRYLSLDHVVNVFSPILLHENEIICHKRDFVEECGQLNQEIHPEVLDEVHLAEDLTLEVNLNLVVEVLVEERIHLLFLQLDLLLVLKNVVQVPPHFHPERGWNVLRDHEPIHVHHLLFVDGRCLVEGTDDRSDPIDCVSENATCHDHREDGVILFSFSDWGDFTVSNSRHCSKGPVDAGDILVNEGLIQELLLIEPSLLHLPDLIHPDVEEKAPHVMSYHNDFNCKVEERDEEIHLISHDHVIKLLQDPLELHNPQDF